MDDFFPNILPIASFVVSLLALGSVFFAWKQINQVNKWNKVKVTADFVDAERAEKLLVPLRRSSWTPQTASGFPA